MSIPLTVAQAATLLGVHRETIKRLCREHGIGTEVNARMRLLTKADVAKLRKMKRPAGNPDWIAKGKRKRKRS